MKHIYKELLLMCGFKEEEAVLHEHELETAIKKVGINEEDLEFTLKEWIPKYFDIELNGIRLFLGAILREFLDITKKIENENSAFKVIYAAVPAPIPLLMAAKEELKGLGYIGTPDILLIILRSIFFENIDKQAERTGVEGLNASCRHCALNKIRVVSVKHGWIPEPDLIISPGILCDEASKTDEFINCFLKSNWQYETVKMPHDTCCDHLCDDEDRIELIEKEMCNVINCLESVTQTSISNNELWAAISRWEKFVIKIRYLNLLISSSDPQPLGGNELSLVATSVLIHFNTGMNYVEEAVDILIKEIKNRIKKGKGILPVGSPKAGCNYIPFCCPWIDRAFINNGVSLSFNTFFPVLDNYDFKIKTSDPVKYISYQMLRLPMINSLFYEAYRISHFIQKMKPAGMVFGFFDFDRWMGMHNKLLLKIVEEKTGIPCYYFEGDFWNEEAYCFDNQLKRVETICNIIKSKTNEKEEF